MVQAVLLTDPHICLLLFLFFLIFLIQPYPKAIPVLIWVHGQDHCTQINNVATIKRILLMTMPVLGSHLCSFNIYCKKIYINNPQLNAAATMLNSGACVRQMIGCGSPDTEISTTAELFIFVQSNQSTTLSFGSCPRKILDEFLQTPGMPSCVFFSLRSTFHLAPLPPLQPRLVKCCTTLITLEPGSQPR